MIDLRSDTMTMPSDEMREIISKAVVGDDVFGEDPTIRELEEYTAELAGKEAALFVPSGTMGNQISININTNPGEELIVEREAHIFQYEAAGPSLLSGVQLNCIESERGMIDLNRLESNIRGDNVHFPRTSLICLENTHNRHSGAIIDLDYIKEVRALADRHGIAMHCDGARVWNACAARAVELRDYLRDFDTVSLCFSKGLGAPVGSAVVGSRDSIDRARRFRKVLGGGMRQAGVLAAAALYGIKNIFPKMNEDHKNAVLFAAKLAESEFIDIDLSRVQTNIVLFKHPEELDSAAIEAACADQGVKIIGFGERTFRAVFYYQIDRAMSEKAGDIVKSVIESMMNHK